MVLQLFAAACRAAPRFHVRLHVAMRAKGWQPREIGAKQLRLGKFRHKWRNGDGGVRLRGTHMKRIIKYISLFVILISYLPTYAQESDRIWTDSMGRKITARLISYDAQSGNVVLRKSDGKEIRISDSKIDDQDRLYLRNIKKNEHLNTQASASESPGTIPQPAAIELLESSTEQTGPFGLRMGMTLEEIGGDPKSLDRPGFYRLSEVPKPHFAFESYVVQVGPKNGLSWIKAIGKDISTGSSGAQLRSSFEDMRKRLEKTYRAHKTIDQLQYGSIWKDPGDWMMALIKKERLLSSVWSKEYRSYLPNNLKAIYLSAYASRSDRGYLAIEYSFINEDAVERELAAISDDAL